MTEQQRVLLELAGSLEGVLMKLTEAEIVLLFETDFANRLLRARKALTILQHDLRERAK